MVHYQCGMTDLMHTQSCIYSCIISRTYVFMYVCMTRAFVRMRVGCYCVDLLLECEHALSLSSRILHGVRELDEP